MSQPENELRVALEEFMPEMELALVMEQVILPKRVAPAWCKLRAALASRAPATTPTPAVGDTVLMRGKVIKIGTCGSELQVQFGDGERWKTSLGWIPSHCVAQAAAPGGKEPADKVFDDGVQEGLEQAALHWPIGELGTLTDFRCSCGATLDSEPDSVSRIAAWKNHIRNLAASHPLQDKPPRFPELQDLVAAMGDCSREFLEGMTESERSIALTTLKAHALVLREDYCQDKPTP